MCLLLSIIYLSTFIIKIKSILLTTHQNQIKLKKIKLKDLRTETQTCLEEYIGKTLQHKDLGDVFLVKPSKRKSEQWKLYQTQKIFHTPGNDNRVKRHAKE